MAKTRWAASTDPGDGGDDPGGAGSCAVRLGILEDKDSGVSGTRFIGGFCTKNYIGVQAYRFSDTACVGWHSETNTKGGWDIRGSGQLKVTNSNCKANGANNTFDQDGSFGVRIHGTATKSVLECYFSQWSISEQARGGWRIPITGISSSPVDYNDGNGPDYWVRIAFSETHRLNWGFQDFALASSVQYPGLEGTNHNVLDVIDSLTVDVQIQYTGDEGDVGAYANLKGKDLWISTEGSSSYVRDMRFHNCNINYADLEGGDNLEFVGGRCGAKERVWIGYTPTMDHPQRLSFNRLELLGRGRPYGITGSWFDPLPYGDAAHEPWGYLEGGYIEDINNGSEATVDNWIKATILPDVNAGAQTNTRPLYQEMGATFKGFEVRQAGKKIYLRNGLISADNALTTWGMFDWTGAGGEPELQLTHSNNNIGLITDQSSSGEASQVQIAFGTSYDPAVLPHAKVYPMDDSNSTDTAYILRLQNNNIRVVTLRAGVATKMPFIIEVYGRLE